MTTQHTHHITIVAEYGSGAQNKLDVEPAGEHLLWDPDSDPGYVDADGTEYRVAEAPWTEEIAKKLRGVENAPQIEVTTTGEVVLIEEIDGREVMWLDDGNGVAMVRLVDRSEVLEGLERIDAEDDIE